MVAGAERFARAPVPNAVGLPVVGNVGARQYQAQQPLDLRQQIPSKQPQQAQFCLNANALANQLRKGENIGMDFHVALEEFSANLPALEVKIRQRFRDFATFRTHPISGIPMRSLDYEAASAMIEWLAKQLQVDLCILEDFQQMFWRFDFSGDGLLDEDEATKLLLYAFRTFRDAAQPSTPGCLRLGGIIEYRANWEDRFKIKKKLGAGAQGAVHLAVDKKSGQNVVIKYYDKSSPNAPIEDITKEFELMMSLKHPRIAHYFDIFQDGANVYVVQEPYFGGDLTTAVQKANDMGVTVNERWMAPIMKQVIAGVAFLHANNVMHCDLKEANVMITGREDWQAPQVVVIDFGLCNKFSSKSLMGGTPGYMPPEVWQHGLWTPKGDVFSIGVIFFAMRTATSPFIEGCQSIEDVQRATLERAPVMNLGTESMKKLTMAMLHKNFRERPSIARVAQDSWFALSEGQNALPDISQSVAKGIERTEASTDLKRAVLADLAARTNLAELRKLNDLFVQLDKDNDGSLSAQEVRNGLTGKWPAEQIERFIHAIKSQGSMSYEEFMGLLMAGKEPEENLLLWKLFCEFDAEKKDYLSLQNIVELLKRPAVARVLGSCEPKQLMREMDQDGNGQISFGEFRAAMLGRASRTFDGLPKSRPSETQEIVIGQPLQYFSETFHSWIPVVVTSIDYKTGAIQIDVKPDYWFQDDEIKTKFQHRSKGVAICQSGAPK